MIISRIENERFLIRPVTAADEDQFMRIHQENSEMKNAYKDEHFRKSFWEKSLYSEDDIYMMIYHKHLSFKPFVLVTTVKALKTA